MKRFLVSILVPAAAAIAVVGSGFSVWYFGDKEVKSDASASLNVENLLEAGSLNKTEVSALFKLHLDQTSETREKVIGASNPLLGLEANGIYLTNEDTPKISKVKYASPTESNKVDHWDTGTVKAKVKVVTTVEIKEALANWVVATGSASTETVTDGYVGFDYVWTPTQVETDGFDLLTELTFKYADFNTATHHYTTVDRKGVTTCEPISSTEYATMKTAVEDITEPMKIVTRATIVKA